MKLKFIAPLLLLLIFLLVPSIVSADEYTPNEAATIYAQVLDGSGNPVNNATATLTLWDSAGNKELDGVSMTYITSSQGLYEYDFTVPSELGVYVVEVVTANPTSYGSGEIHVVETVGVNATCSTNGTAIWSEPTSNYTDSLTFGGLLNSIFGGDDMTLPQVFFILGLLGFALWKKGWIRTLFSVCIIIWGVFSMSYDIKIAAPLIAIGSILFIQAIVKLIQQAGEQQAE